MATKETLEAREADCSSVADFVALAREALADPADPDYAKDLLEKGEIECQFPGEYVDVAEAAHEAGLVEYADEVYEQAEEACFEAMEFARLGHSLGAVRGEKEKAREMLEKAAEEAKELPDILQISQSARDALGDEEFAKGLLEKVEGDCKTLEDYKKLAASVLTEAKDADAARAFYGKAEKFSMDLDTTITFAEGANEIFEDKEWVGEILEEVESDCQFTKEFVTLAGAYHRLTGDSEKVGELMEQAEEFAMTGEEQVQLAEGAFKILGDREKASEAYEKALGEISGRDELFGLAATIAKELEDKELAKKVYAKAEDKLTGVADACKLARAVKEDLGDADFAREVYSRAEGKFDSASDAGALAKDLLEVLDDKEGADRLFRSCLDGTEGFADLGKLFDTVREGVGSEDLNRVVLTKQASAAAAPKEFMSVADRAMDVLSDKEFAAGMLDQAEERVTSLPEMKAVVEAVDKHLADDADRVTRVKEKYEKREANQSRYEEFQSREAELVTCRQYVILVDEMMADLDDRYYAAKLCTGAEDALSSGVFEVNGYQGLAISVERHLGDKDWVKRILDGAAERVSTYAEARSLARAAAKELEDGEFGGEWAREFLTKQSEGLGASEGAGAYDFTKLAGTVLSELGDKDWAAKVLSEAEKRADTPFKISHVGRMFAKLGDQSKADELYRKASGGCSSARDCVQLVSSYRDLMGEEELREHYATCGKSLGEARRKLRWAEGILELFDDRDWARNEYRGMASSFTDPEEKARFLASQKVHFGEKFC